MRLLRCFLFLLIFIFFVNLLFPICNESVFPKVHTKLHRKILDNILVYAFTKVFHIIQFSRVKYGSMHCTQQVTVGYNEGLLTQVVLNQKERNSPHACFNQLQLLQLFGEPPVCSQNIPRMKVLSRSQKKARIANPETQIQSICFTYL